MLRSFVFSALKVYLVKGLKNASAQIPVTFRQVELVASRSQTLFLGETELQKGLSTVQYLHTHMRERKEGHSRYKREREREDLEILFPPSLHHKTKLVSVLK